MAGPQAPAVLGLAIGILTLCCSTSLTLFARCDNPVEAGLPTQRFWYNDVTQESVWSKPEYEFKDEESRTYYVDPVSKAASWDKPEALQWLEATDEQGRTYYFNEVSKETTWDKPYILGWRQIPVSEGDKTEL